MLFGSEPAAGGETSSRSRVVRLRGTEKRHKEKRTVTNQPFTLHLHTRNFVVLKERRKIPCKSLAIRMDLLRNITH
jgi:hypothetical protein